MKFDEMVAEWQIADATNKAAKERFDKITNELAQYMLLNEIKSDLVCVRGDDYKVTVVAAETVRVDEEGLRKAIGAVAYRRICKQKVDNKLLDAAVRDGVLSLDTVAEHVTIKKNTPHVRVTRSLGEDQ
jgi:hypothetical protein